MRCTRLLCLVLAGWALPAIAADPAALSSDKDRQSYAIGVDIARRFEKLGAEFDAAALARGITDASSHQPLALGDEDLHAGVAAFQGGLEKKRTAALARAAEGNLKEGEAFRDDYRRQPGVVSLPSGLLYRVLTPGSGRKPTLEDAIECRYQGKLIDGRVFERTPADQPVPIKLGAVIPGWKEALVLMPVGAKYEIVVPPALGYGERGNGRDVGPNTTVIYEIELLAVK